MKKIEWNTEKRLIKDLLATDNNPRSLSKKQHEDLKKSLTKFDLAEIPAINTDNKILAGHQRLKILAEIKDDNFEIDVRVPNRTLTEKEAQEYLIRSNKNIGEWDLDILGSDFELDDLLEWGFEKLDFDLPKTNKQINEQDIPEKFEIIIECQDEVEQKEKFEMIVKLGYKCRLMNL